MAAAGPWLVRLMQCCALALLAAVFFMITLAATQSSHARTAHVTWHRRWTLVHSFPAANGAGPASGEASGRGAGAVDGWGVPAAPLPERVRDLSKGQHVARRAIAGQGAGAAPPAPAPGVAGGASGAGAPVALLFLTRGALPHEGAWVDWLRHAADLVPVSALRAEPCLEGAAPCACEEGRLQLAARACTPRLGLAPLHRQHLFSLYVHAALNFTGFPDDSVFQGRLIRDWVKVEWGTHSLAVAAVRLLAAALADPLNTKFVLLSDSCLPLYPPATLYQQLVSEAKSRVDACGLGWRDEWRRHSRMSAAVVDNWRKSSQWFALSRAHAEAVAGDEAVAPDFERFCRSFWDWEAMRRAPRWAAPSGPTGPWALFIYLPAPLRTALFYTCYSDEHYVPTLLAVQGRAAETDCLGLLANVVFNRTGAHPRAYEAPEITPHLFQRLRRVSESFYVPDEVRGTECRAEEAIRAAGAHFVWAGELAARAGAGGCAVPDGAYQRAQLPYACPLTARKFPPAAAPAARAALASCALVVTRGGAACIPSEA